MVLNRSVRLAVVVAAMAGAGAAGGAQPERPRPAREREAGPPAPSDAPPLRGPAVRDEQAPGPGGGMTSEGRGPGGERIPARVFMEAVRWLGGAEAPAGVRLTDEQRDRVRVMGEEFARERREYMQKHREELAELRAATGRGGEGAGRGPRRDRDGDAGRPMDEMAPPPEGTPPERRTRTGDGAGAEPGPEARAAAARMREIERGGPQPEDLHKRVWAELNGAQREALEGRLEEFRVERAREREEAYVRQRAPGAPRGGGEDGMAPGPRGRPGPGDEPGRAERRDRLMRLFNSMTPEEQEVLLERLEMRARERRAGPGGDRPARRPAERPAPGMDEVDVPREPGPGPDR